MVYGLFFRGLWSSQGGLSNTGGFSNQMIFAGPDSTITGALLPLLDNKTVAAVGALPSSFNQSALFWCGWRYYSLELCPLFLRKSGFRIFLFV